MLNVYYYVDIELYSQSTSLAYNNKSIPNHLRLV